MTLRRRITLVAACAVAVAVGLAVLTAYFAVRSALSGQVDTELLAQAQNDIASLQSPSNPPNLPARAGGPAPWMQYVLPSGSVVPVDANGERVDSTSSAILPVITRDVAVASGTAQPFFRNVTVDGAQLRMYTFQVSGNFPDNLKAFAIQLARPLVPVNNTLRELRRVLIAVFLLVVLLAAIIARYATHKVLAPLDEVTATAEHIAETEDLDQRIAIRKADEVGQLARRFNEMLERLAGSRAALDESVTQQRQLVADASHELRTPVTSLRTNAEILMESGEQLDPEDRHKLLEDVVEQTEELSTLVADLIEVGRGELPDTSMSDERLDDLVEEALVRARRNSPHTDFAEQLAPIIVRGNPERLSRAINNLLDNAARHTEPGTKVEVTVDDIGLTVRDHGTGIAEADLPHIFERFYRGASSRGKQGSGLGLAIVRQVAEQHHGAVGAANATDGGAVFTLALPTERALPDTSDPAPPDPQPTR